MILPPTLSCCQCPCSDTRHSHTSGNLRLSCTVHLIVDLCSLRVVHTVSALAVFLLIDVIFHSKVVISKRLLWKQDDCYYCIKKYGSTSYLGIAQVLKWPPINKV